MNWRALGASVTGTSHTQTGLPCQDAHAWSTAPILCIAASDGADLLSFCSVEGSSSEAIARFLEGLENDQTGDDKTLVVAVRTQATSAELWV